MAGIWLSMVEYLRYVNGNENSRCVQEGEEVLNAGHIILYGKTEGGKNEMKVIALCLQSSAIYSDPHEIVGSLAVEHRKVNIIKMTCSCKAGLGGACKHISGVLILFTRVDLSKMETISPTDLKCVWSTQKTKIQEKYKAAPLSGMPCLRGKLEKTKCDLTVSSEDILSDIASLLPECALSRLRTGRSNADELTIEEVDVQDGGIFSIILDHSSQSILMMKLSSENIAFHSNCCEKLYSTLMNEGQDEAIAVPQNSSTWHEMRKFRITGSRCYEIFTYCGKNWITKAEKYFWPNSLSNKYINHGLKFEDDARRAFVAASGYKVVQCGMVISHSNKWVGYSPDGIIIDNDRPVALLEIKCLWNGATSTITEAIKNCSFISTNSLKKKHKYYGQIQFGLSLLNLKKCYLALYSSYDDSLMILEVDHDENFAEKMLMKIKYNYFHNMLHTICGNSN